MKVLIVDDSIMIRERIAEMIAGNHQIDSIAEAEGKRDAIELFSHYLPDVVILNIHLDNGAGTNRKKGCGCPKAI